MSGREPNLAFDERQVPAKRLVAILIYGREFLQTCKIRRQFALYESQAKVVKQ
jgi:hypothetical protein